MKSNISNLVSGVVSQFPWTQAVAVLCPKYWQETVLHFPFQGSADHPYSHVVACCFSENGAEEHHREKGREAKWIKAPDVWLTHGFHCESVPSCVFSPLPPFLMRQMQYCLLWETQLSLDNNPRDFSWTNVVQNRDLYSPTLSDMKWVVKSLQSSWCLG